jgi:hypothetical protein
MIEIGRRGFFTGLIALVAAPAVIRVAPLMPISTRHIPLYVPVSWLDNTLLDVPRRFSDLKLHAWPQPQGAAWVNINDYDPGFVKVWAARLREEAERTRWRGYA